MMANFSVWRAYLMPAYLIDIISIYLYICICFATKQKIVELTDTVSGSLTESNEPKLVEVLRLVEVVRVELVWVGEAVLLLGQNH